MIFGPHGNALGPLVAAAWVWVLGMGGSDCFWCCARAAAPAKGRLMAAVMRVDRHLCATLGRHIHGPNDEDLITHDLLMVFALNNRTVKSRAILRRSPDPRRPR